LRFQGSEEEYGLQETAYNDRSKIEYDVKTRLAAGESADGRGGQYIRVLPQLNMVIVTTGGFAWNDITPYLAPAMVDSAEPIPANPNAMEQLNVMLTAILQPPTPHAVPPLPETAYNISGKTYTFEFSPLDFKTIRWEFDGSPEARMFVTFYNQPDRELLVGMDGVCRLYPIGEHDLPMGIRGSWTDLQKFLFENDTIANHDAYALELHFEGDIVTINARERTKSATMTLEGKVQK
jgi:hypothetical protein